MGMNPEEPESKPEPVSQFFVLQWRSELRAAVAQSLESKSITFTCHLMQHNIADFAPKLLVLVDVC
jgi:hypothetical protein